ncbi:hypothetical protein ACFFGH_03270 [Lysobacter korlensis]|uniref:Glycosyltransferase RgtA/B/C/D-like domain-containing protein n=1 Tax=Lysobacter korlensis TaxID=553636 RepID=A0ABV6RKF5_9GAMM
MSALLYWLGLGTVGTSLFVALNAAATYGAFRLAVGSQDGGEWAWWRWILALAVIANPVVFTYVGIVWKDVLLGSLCAASLGLSIAALHQSRGARLGFAVLALAMLLPIPLVRQQGIVLLPLFAISPAYLVIQAGWRTPGRRRIAGLAVLAGVVLGYLGVRAAVEASFEKNATGSIYTAQGDDVSIGTRLIKRYDLAGIEVRAEGAGPLSRSGAGSEALAQLHDRYTGERIDTLGSPAIQSMFEQVETSGEGDAWANAVADHPAAYIAHRLSAFSWLLGFEDPWRCLPVHVGTDGIPEYLAESGFRPEQEARDSRLFSLVKPLVATPLWRHWFYIGLGLVLAVLVWRRDPETRWTLLPWIAGLGVFVGGYLPTSIACDFRYLYLLVPCSALLALALLRPQSPIRERCR